MTQDQVGDGEGDHGGRPKKKLRPEPALNREMFKSHEKTVVDMVEYALTTNSSGLNANRLAERVKKDVGPVIASQLSADVFRLLSEMMLAEVRGRGGQATFQAPPETLQVSVLEELHKLFGFTPTIRDKIKVQWARRPIHEAFQLEPLQTVLAALGDVFTKR